MHLDWHRHTVVGSILLAADQLFGVKKMAIGAGADLINWLHNPESSISIVILHVFIRGMTYARVEIGEDSAGNVFAAAGLSEKGLVYTAGGDLVGDVGVTSTVGFETVLKKVPAFVISKVNPWDRA